jgi:hypothetical protein
MSTSALVRPSVRTTFQALIDYAGLFPPAALEPSEALAEYARARDDANAWMLGRFIVTASRLGSIAVDRALSLSVIVDAEPDARRWFGAVQATLAVVARLRSGGGNLSVGAIEAPMPPLETARETFDASIGQFAILAERAGLRDLPIYIELPRSGRSAELVPSSLEALARARLGAKIRCGGTVAEAFPSIEDVAAFIRAAADAKVPFKATAGLHHPVRHRDGNTGFMMHGFLNIIAATALAERVDDETLRSIVGEERADAFSFDDTGLHWRDFAADAGALAAMRERGFVGYGSCSFREPVEDLIDLSILPA